MEARSKRRWRWLAVVCVAWLLQAGHDANARASECTPVPVETGGVHGLSGLTVTPSGRVVAVSEDHVLLELAEGAGAWRVKRRSPLGGFDTRDGREPESVTAIGETDFWIGTEAKRARTRDVLYRVSWAGGDASVQGELEVDYDAWGLRAESNRGLEGVCHAGGWTLTVAEPVIRRRDDGAGPTRDAVRVAPLALFGPGETAPRTFELALTTETGKAAGLACRLDAEGGALEVRGIERHYGVSHLLFVRIPLPAGPGDAAPRRIGAYRTIDLVERLALDEMPNFEGIAWRGAGLLLVSDNQHGGVSGKTWILDLTCLDAR